MSDKPNNFFSFFNGAQKKKETKKIIFDENYFNLQIAGGKKHSDKIIIEAISIVDSEKLGTDIKWFQISPNNDFQTLDIVGNEYQPSIEDVGSKFMIQVVPIQEGRQYEGMPKSMEIGPLERDEEIQEEIDEMLENEKMTILVTIEKIIKQNHGIEAELPLNCLLKITLKNIELQLKKNEQIIHTFDLPLDAQYPSCISKQGTSESFILKLDPNNEFIMKAQDNQMRDVILSVIKGFYGKSIWKLNQVDHNDEEESDDHDEEEEENGQDEGDIQLTKNEEIVESQVNNEDNLQQIQEDEKPEVQQEEQSIPKIEEQLQEQQQDPNIQVNIQEILEIKEQEPVIEQNVDKPILQEEQAQVEEQVNVQQKEENQQITSTVTQLTPKKEESIPEQIQDSPQIQMEQVILLQTQPVDENNQNLLVSEILIEKEIRNEAEIENDAQVQAPQKQRIDHKIQSVIVTSENNKEEKASPTKKKEKKNNADLYMYLNENVKLKQEIEQFKLLQQKDQEQIKKQQNQIVTLSEQLANCTRNYYQLEEECNNQKKIMHSLNDQKVFLQQDINMYKTQLLELTEQSSNQKEEIDQLKKKYQRQAQSSDLTEAKKQIEQLKDLLAKRDLMLEAANQNNISAKKQIDDLEKEIESYQNQLTHEKKKYESLAIEKGIKQPISYDKQRFNEKPQRPEKQVAQSMIQLDDSDRYSIDISQSLNNLDTDVEVNRLKTQIMHLEATLRSLKIAYEQDVRFTKGKTGKGLHGSSKDIKYLQHIANNMAEIITEKETQLENQKKINKELLTKLQILQQQHQ